MLSIIVIGGVQWWLQCFKPTSIWSAVCKQSCKYKRYTSVLQKESYCNKRFPFFVYIQIKFTFTHCQSLELCIFKCFFHSQQGLRNIPLVEPNNLKIINFQRFDYLFVLLQSVSQSINIISSRVFHMKLPGKDSESCPK